MCAEESISTQEKEPFEHPIVLTYVHKVHGELTAYASAQRKKYAQQNFQLF